MSLAKPPETRQRRNMPAVLDDVGRDLGVPSPPSRLPVTLRRQWAGLWRSPVAALLDPVSDLPTVTRLFDLYRLGARLDRMIAQAHPEGEAGRLVRRIDDLDPLTLAGVVAEASAARQALNQTISTRMRVATECRMLEGQLGLSPRARLALGVALRRIGGPGGGLDDFLDD